MPTRRARPPSNLTSPRPSALTSANTHENDTRTSAAPAAAMRRRRMKAASGGNTTILGRLSGEQNRRRDNERHPDQRESCKTKLLEQEPANCRTDEQSEAPRKVVD